MPSAWTTDTKNHFKLDAAVLSLGTPPAKYLTRGGVAVAFEETLRNPEFDGKTTDIAGQDRITFRAARMTVTILELETVKLMRLIPGATSATAGAPAVTTITPGDAGINLNAGLIAPVSAEGRRSDGKLIRIVFPKAWPRITGIDSAHGSEGGITVEISARLDMDAGGATTDDAPYYFEIQDAA